MEFHFHNRFQNWIFDLDGTLVDSWQDLVDAVNLLRIAYNLQPLPFTDVRVNIGWGMRHLLTKSIPEYADKFEKLQEHFIQIYDKHLLDKTALFPGIFSLLQNLIKDEKTLFILTNKPEVFTHKILYGLHIHDLFTEIICGDTLPIRKPDAGTLRYLAEKYHLLLDQIVMIGDSQVDNECANAFGCAFIHLNYVNDIFADAENSFQPQNALFSGSAIELNKLLLPKN